MDVAAAGKAVIMGIVEGLTEFLPVSSTGHLIVAGKVIGFDDIGSQAFTNMFEVVIQLGAILAVCWYFRERMITLLRGLIAGNATERRFAMSLIAAFIPTAIIGLALHHVVEAHFMNPGVVATTLALGGLAILIIENRPRVPVYTTSDALPWSTLISIGLFQSLSAVFPGTSRSGATIMGSLLLGVERKAATEFSFFLAIPTMFAATGYDLFKHRHDLTSEGVGLTAIGFVVSFIVALGVVHWLISFVSSNTFKVFGWYRIVAGLLLAIAMVMGLISTF